MKFSDPKLYVLDILETRVSDQLPDLPIDQMAGEGAGPGVPRCVVKVHCENLAEVSLQAF